MPKAVHDAILKQSEAFRPLLPDPCRPAPPMPECKPPRLERNEIITIAAGDALVVTCDQMLTTEQVARIKANTMVGLPTGCTVVVLHGGLKVAAVAKANPAAWHGGTNDIKCSGSLMTYDPAPIGDFDAWMRDRTNAAHAAYMERHAAGGISYARKPRPLFDEHTMSRLHDAFGKVGKVFRGSPVTKI